MPILIQTLLQGTVSLIRQHACSLFSGPHEKTSLMLKKHSDNDVLHQQYRHLYITVVFKLCSVG